MPKIVAFLLVPCLMADPVLAVALSCPQPMAGHAHSSQLFNSQALAEFARQFPQNRRISSETYRSEAEHLDLPAPESPPVHLAPPGFPGLESAFDDAMQMFLSILLESDAAAPHVPRAPPLGALSNQDPARPIDVRPDSPLFPYAAEMNEMAVKLREEFHRASPQACQIIDRQGYVFTIVASTLILKRLFNPDQNEAIRETVEAFPLRHGERRKQVAEYIGALHQILDFAAAGQEGAAQKPWVEQLGRFEGFIQYGRMKNRPDSPYRFRDSPLKAKESRDCMDLAAGPNFAKFIPNLDPESHYIAIDQSAFVVAFILEVARLYGARNVAAVEADVWTLQRPEKPLGLIRAKNVTTYIPGFEKKVEEMLDWLGEGGQLVLEVDGGSITQRRTLYNDYGLMIRRLIDEGWSLQYQPETSNGFAALVLTKPAAGAVQNARDSRLELIHFLQDLILTGLPQPLARPGHWGDSPPLPSRSFFDQVTKKTGDLVEGLLKMDPSALSPDDQHLLSSLGIVIADELEMTQFIPTGPDILAGLRARDPAVILRTLQGGLGRPDFRSFFGAVAKIAGFAYSPYLGLIRPLSAEEMNRLGGPPEFSGAGMQRTLEEIRNSLLRASLMREDLPWRERISEAFAESFYARGAVLRPVINALKRWFSRLGRHFPFGVIFIVFLMDFAQRALTYDGSALGGPFTLMDSLPGTAFLFSMAALPRLIRLTQQRLISVAA